MTGKKLKTMAALFGTFFKIGLFTFGGGYAMIPLIEREIAQRKGWIDKEKMTDILALSQSIPGAIAINAATFIGLTVGGRLAAVVSTLGVILPSFLVITLIAAFFGSIGGNRYVVMAFAGIRPVIVALIAWAAWKIGKASIRDLIGWAIALASFALVAFFRVSPVWVILGGAALGSVLYGFRPKKKGGASGKEEFRP